MKENKNLPLVSVFCPTFNHEKVIHECIKNIIEQKVNFSFELIIHDDSSTDKTVEVIKEYKNKYPEVIKLILQKENQYSKGLGLIGEVFYPVAKGKYISFCDGDDYWSDPLKLQKQVDFLDLNPEFIGCCHNTKILRETIKDESIEEVIVNDMQKDIFSINDFTKGEAYFHTSSVMYRNDRNREELLRLLSLYRGDWFVSMAFASFGSIKYLDEVMSVYRIHEKGIWSELTKQGQILKNLEAILKINKAFNYKYEKNLMELFSRIYVESKIDNTIESLSSLFCEFSKDELIKVIFYIEKYVQEKDKSIQEKEQNIKNRESYIQSVQSTKAWKICSLLKKIKGMK